MTFQAGVEIRPVRLPRLFRGYSGVHILVSRMPRCADGQRLPVPVARHDPGRPGLHPQRNPTELRHQ